MAGIDDVIASLGEIVSSSLERGDRMGYFAALYRKVTGKIKEGVEEGFFDDAERMVRFDVAFAGRYLDAQRAFQAAEPPTRCWEFAFRTTTQARPLVLQHLLLGINAHINLDLGIAAAEVAPGAALPSLRRDFDRINEILGLLVHQVGNEVGSISPCIGLLDWFGGRQDEELIHFSVEVARAEAWRFATELAPLDREDWGGPIGARDARVAHLARMVLNPGWPLNVGLAAIRLAESNDVARNIEVLNSVQEPSLATVERRVRQERA